MVQGSAPELDAGSRQWPSKFGIGFQVRGKRPRWIYLESSLYFLLFDSLSSDCLLSTALGMGGGMEGVLFVVFNGHYENWRGLSN